jgi:uracil-DNA glycosylase family 4
MKILNNEIVTCRRCPRLVEWREMVALKKKKVYSHWQYWGKPVPGFGDINGRILVLGLAPGAHGSNRTGRMFTGDASGDFLYPALFEAGYASQPDSRSVNDRLTLNDLFISAVCRCAPPDNKPAREEMTSCRPFLKAEIGMMQNLKGIVALGRIAFDSALDLIKNHYPLGIKTHPEFGHGMLYFEDEPESTWLLASYHPSRQNTQTGRLTNEMFSGIWKKTKVLLRE